MVKKILQGVVTLLASMSWSNAEAAAGHPNIIFILADDLGYADLGCYGQKHIRTPNIDRLAAEGMRFTDCYSGASVCAPSRSVLLTGLHTGHTRVRGNFGITGGVGPQGRVPLEPGDFTAAELLQGGGYRTGITGKWGLGEPGSTGVPNRQGFQAWFGYLNQRSAHTYYPPYLWRDETRVELEGNRDGQRGQYSHDMMTEFALDFVRHRGKEAFFLFLAWTIPHGRYEVPSLEPYAETSWPREARAYAAMVTRMDRDVGRLMALLKELGIDGKTIVFFASDNGAARRWDGLFDSAGPFRGKKGGPYEGGLRVPMMVRWPGRIPAGSVCREPCYFADFLPTAADLAGLDVPAPVDGISILPLLLGKQRALPGRFLYWEQIKRNEFRQAVRWGIWKAVRNKPGGPLELYDLGKDIGEKRNVAGEHPDVVKEIEAYLKKARTDSPCWPLPGEKGKRRRA